jgi:hypothetical protein
VAGEVASNIFGSKTIYPLTSVASRIDPSLSPRGEGIIWMKGTKEKTTKGQSHKVIRARPKFQQINEGDGE